MRQFEKYDPISTLKDDGFQVFSGATSNDIFEELSDILYDSIITSPSRSTPVVLLDLWAFASRDRDIFRTKLGDIKQIQNLHKLDVDSFEAINKKLASLIGWHDFTTLNNQLFCKPSNYKMTSPHQDNAYFETTEDVVTFWIPLSPVHLLNSCMFYVPKSHLNGLVEHKPIGTNVRTRTGKTGLSLYSDHYENKEFVMVEMDMGEILVHDKNSMHFSSPNLTDDYRIAFTAILKRLK